MFNTPHIDSNMQIIHLQIDKINLSLKVTDLTNINYNKLLIIAYLRGLSDSSLSKYKPR